MPTPPKQIAIILNAGSGAGSATDVEAALAAQCAEAGARVEFIHLGPDLDLTEAIRAAVARGVEAVIAGGGDGTVNAVANRVIDAPVLFGVLPLGTLNHFAKDLGIPVAVDQAMATILAGHTIRVDAAMVNDRVFLNNSSVGLYPRIVQLRERYRARGLEKWAIAVWATYRVTQKMRPLRLTLGVDDAKLVRITPLVFIGNNEYRMAGFDAGTRESVQRGQLALYVVRPTERLGLARLVWRILVGTAQESGALAMETATEAVLDVPSSAITQLPVAVDGEVDTLDLPLRYAIRPGALRVLVPAPAA